MAYSIRSPQSLQTGRRAFVCVSLSFGAVSLLSGSRTGQAQEIYDGPVYRGSAAALAPMQATAPGSRSSLDGLIFRGPTGVFGMAAHHEEVIQFRAGRLSSAECARWGFEPAKYRAFRIGKRIRFEATLISKEYGQIDWAGEVSNQSVTATYHWQKKRLFWTLKNSYWFTADSAG